ncbi:MAG: FHA domain-containing protein [Rhodovibrio sp.]|nr:FHA domain-containing protein [Rhodovibrio sp.]
MQASFLTHERFRHLKVAFALGVLSIAAYALHDPVGDPGGGTWLGYTLGGLGAALILMLLWYGVRKRRFRSRLGTVRGWLSAHVYLGVALLVITTLHTGFQFGWNIHTLAYALMVIVIVSGLYGVYAYRRYPDLMTANRTGVGPQAMLDEIGSLEQQAVELADRIDDPTHQVVLRSIRNNRIGGGVLAQLRGGRPKKAEKEEDRAEEFLEQKNQTLIADLEKIKEQEADRIVNAESTMQFVAGHLVDAKRGRAVEAHPPADGPAVPAPRPWSAHRTVTSSTAPCCRSGSICTCRCRSDCSRPSWRTSSPCLPTGNPLMQVLVRHITRRSQTGTGHSDKPVAGDTLTIGRGADADVFLQDLHVALRHAVLRRASGGRFTVQARTPSGVKINGRMTQAGTVSAGDTIGVGLSTLRLQRGGKEYDVVIEVDEARGRSGGSAESGATSLRAAGLGRRRWAWALFLVVLALGLGLPLAEIQRERNADAAEVDDHADPNAVAADGYGRALAVFRAYGERLVAGGDRIWDSGPMSQPHRFFGQDCRQCHRQPFQRVTDAACLDCHENQPAPRE